MTIQQLEQSGWRLDENAVIKELEVTEQGDIINDDRKLKEYLLDVRSLSSLR